MMKRQKNASPLSLYALILVMAGGCVSCKSAPPTAPLPETQSLLGLYEITERHCEGVEIGPGSCHEIQYIEVVHGQFYGIADDEMAFTTWFPSGEPDAALLYTARHFEGPREVVIGDAKLAPIVREDESEGLRLITGQKGVYQMGAAASAVLYFEKVDRSTQLAAKMPYPGND